MNQLVIIGAGGHGRELLDVVEAPSSHDSDGIEFLGFLDDGTVDTDLLARRGAQLLGDTASYASIDAGYLIGIGDPAVRCRFDQRLGISGDAADPLVHRVASVGSDNEFAPGVVLCAGARVTTNVRLGRHTHLNVNAVVSHDCRVGAHVTISPGVFLNGNVSVGERVFIGTAAIVLPGIQIGDDALIGAGAVVTTDVKAGTTVAGVPARLTVS